VPVVVVALGGFGSAASSVSAKNPDLLQLTGNVSLADGNWASAGTLGLVTIVSGLAWGLGYFGQPHILARFMGIRSASQIPRARKIGVTYGITAMTAAVVIGLAGIAYFDQPLANPESVFLRLVDELFNPWIAGLLLVGVLAAVMSTASSQLLVVASALSEDFYRRFFNRGASGAHFFGSDASLSSGWLWWPTCSPFGVAPFSVWSRTRGQGLAPPSGR
jgi:sodium/proline symporter